MAETYDVWLSRFQEYRNHMASYIWANDLTVRDALHVRKGTRTAEWNKCRKPRDYDQNVASALPYHEALSKTRYKALAYSGNHDAMVSYLATLKWIRHLNLTVDDDLRPWMVNDEVAGFTKRYKRDEFHLTFATIKGAGHTAPECKPVECLAMVHRWFSSSPL
ncbi:putative serine carboxypeptidase-like 52 [Sesamum indicum]|uniref:Serine carboxypeptidase-like 52 n=1 Tax=Sesamum indicum TaxID=4182 RepID=A0A6I9SUM0_SESIN|nr:putative serine carboxypeptidase-like 52 [Sesamum indicum]